MPKTKKKIWVEVLGCPWCKKPPTFTKIMPHRSIIEIHCTNEKCVAKTSVYGDSIEDALKKWNDRPQDPMKYEMDLTEPKWSE